MLDAVRKRFIRPLELRCSHTAIIKLLNEVFDDEYMRIFSILRREDLLDHYMDVMPNALRSGPTSIPKGTSREDVVNNHFSWRICCRLNSTQLPSYQ